MIRNDSVSPYGVDITTDEEEIRFRMTEMKWAGIPILSKESCKPVCGTES